MVSCLGSLCSFEDSDALGSPLPVPLQVIPDALCPNLFTIIVLFYAQHHIIVLFPIETVTTLYESVPYYLFVLTLV